MLRTLSRAFFGQISHSFAKLPYNANWHLKRVHEFADFFSRHPLTVCDVGARGADLSELANLKQFVDFIGFEADPQEAELLQRSGQHGYRRYEVLPYFVGSKNGLQDFHLFKDRELSSSFAPNPAFQRDFGTDQCCIEKTIQVESRTLDQVFTEQQRALPDVVKLDTQGSELGILSASPQVLAHASLVEVEVEF